MLDSKKYLKSKHWCKFENSKNVLCNVKHTESKYLQSWHLFTFFISTFYLFTNKKYFAENKEFDDNKTFIYIMKNL